MPDSLLDKLGRYEKTRTVFVLIGVFVFCSVQGCADLMFRLTHWHPTPITCAELSATSSPPKWIELTGCSLDVSTGDSVKGSGNPEGLILIRTVDATGGGRPVALLITHDPAHLDAIRRFSIHPGRAAERGQVPYREVFETTGLIRPEFRLSQEEHEVYAELIEGKGGDLPVVDAGASPAILGALLYLAGAVAAVVVLVAAILEE